jgi:hypothetical protein
MAHPACRLAKAGVKVLRFRERQHTSSARQTSFFLSYVLLFFIGVTVLKISSIYRILAL